MTNQQEKTNNNLIIYSLILTVVGWIILAVIFGIFDLQISIFVVNENNIFGIFGADYGEIPAWVVIIVAGTVLGGGFNPNVKLQKIATPVAVVICILAAFVAYLLDSVDYIRFFIAGAIGVVIFTLIMWNKDWAEYRKIALLILLLAILNSLIFVQMTKIFWGRIRFRDLSSFSDFTPWFIPRGITGNESFPSGHTAMGWMLLPILIIIKNEKKSIRIPITVVVLGWGLFVGISRILVGAHYASDVLFSTGSAIVMTIILYKIIFRK